jgi:hypothetical protein
MSTSQKSVTSQWTRIDQYQDAFLPRFYEHEMPASFRTPVVAFDDELDDGDFEYEAALMKVFSNEEEDKTVERLRQILDHLNPLYNTPLANTLKEHTTDIKTSLL